MSVTPSHISASLAASPLQQHQSAAASDRGRDAAARSSQRMRQLLARHTEAVEDAYETTDEPLAIHDEPPRNSSHTDQQPQGETEQDEPAAPPREAGGPPASEAGHIDIQA